MMKPFKIVSVTVVFLIILGLAGVLTFVYSGFFNISAQEKELPLLDWLLVTTRERSITVHAGGIKAPPNLQNPAVIREGFDHYREMCVACHRAPGLGPSELSQGLNPSPPNFSQMKQWDMTPEEVFWVVKNGIRMTGMPAWGASHDDEKIWALVAFLETLPGMTPEHYQAMEQKAGPQTHEE
ncbi:cytochrome c [Legionella anisa]|uniref:Cytochrome c n=1 Tax=Legionella anisa TaxID=28082 RepID=A0AAX0X3A4_9GAMM|nr:cytochrome c [Legionella anisa]KTC68622.1 hypothetical protein Lani_2909 [Legionella anisa]PNL73966.1 cytochrome c [Legionella anisa]UAK81490.1 cytochrome c [Legionella anisa]